MDELLSGGRLTRQRRAILDALRSTTAHPDAQWIFERVRQRMPQISLGTIYRNLDFLTRSGVILQIPTRDSAARFDGSTHLHGHITCLRCRRIDDVDLPPSVRRLNRVAPDGYRRVEVKIEFEGVCPRCE